MKRAITAILTLAMMVTMMVAPASAAESSIKVTVDGVPVVWTDAAPFIDENGRTMVPLRAIGEAMGLEVLWDQENQVAAFIRDYDNGWSMAVTFRPSSNYFGLYGADMPEQRETFPGVRNEGTSWYPQHGMSEDADENEGLMDTYAVVKDGRTYAPVRYLAEALEFDVFWDQATSTVKVEDRHNWNLNWTYKATSWIAFKNPENVESIEVTGVFASLRGGGQPVPRFDTVEFTPMTDETLEKVSASNEGDFIYGVEYSYDFGELAEGANATMEIRLKVTKTNGIVVHYQILLPVSN